MRRAIYLFVLTPLLVEAYLLPDDVRGQVPIEDPPVVSATYLPPPPPQQEVIVPSPSPQFVWIAGHWDRTPDKWKWNPGTWVKPPFFNAYWSPGYWQHRGGKYVWEDAHWAAANQGVVVNQPIVVPAAYQEVQPPAPPATAAMTWQPGHWEWRGTWVWIPGAYVESTIANASWVPGKWLQSSDGSWLWSPAHWTN